MYWLMLRFSVELTLASRGGTRRLRHVSAGDFLGPIFILSPLDQVRFGSAVSYASRGSRAAAARVDMSGGRGLNWM